MLIHDGISYADDGVP